MRTKLYGCLIAEYLGGSLFGGSLLFLHLISNLLSDNFFSETLSKKDDSFSQCFIQG